MSRENAESRKRNHYYNRCRLLWEKMRGAINGPLVFTIAIHIVMVVIGSIYIDKCPVEHKIPIFLVAEGVIGIVSKLLSITRNKLIKYIKVYPIITVIGLLEFAFFICGSYWVYKEFEPNYDPSSGNLYCNKTVYLFSLVYISCAYVILLIILFVILCTALIVIIFCMCVEEEIDIELNNVDTQTDSK